MYAYKCVRVCLSLSLFLALTVTLSLQCSKHRLVIQGGKDS